VGGVGRVGSAAATLFLWISRSQVGPAYKTALTISGLVTAIAAYHYWRIFESWESAYQVRDGAVTVTEMLRLRAQHDAREFVTSSIFQRRPVIALSLIREESRQLRYHLCLSPLTSI